MKYFAPTKLSENIRETPEGFLLCIGVPIGRTGEMEYLKDELPEDFDAGPLGKVIMQRSAEELFSPAAMASFEGKAFTITHPEEFVNPENWRELAKGHVQNVRKGQVENADGEQEDALLADILISDQIAIGMVKNGLREVSCGYDADFVQTEPGRGFQKDIIGNHLALVHQGRAGPSIAINDHKPKEGRKMPKNISEKLKAIFVKAKDEAAKLVDESAVEEDQPSKVGDEQKKAMDELFQICNAMNEKIQALTGGSKKDADPAPEKKEEAKEKAADEEQPSGIEDRLKALEASVAKLLERLSSEASDEEGDEDEGEFSDEDGDDDSVVETGDAAGEDDDESRAEILAPGLSGSKNIKARALKAAWETTDGKKLIKSLTKGRTPAFDSAAEVETLFRATSELLKVSRGADMASTKKHVTSVADGFFNTSKNAVTADEMNEINAKAYAKK